MDKRNQFTFYRSFVEALDEFPREEWLGFLLAVIYYALDKKLMEDMTSTQRGMFKLVKPVLDSAWEKAEKGSVGGKKTKASKLASKKEEEADKENEIDKENDIESERFDSFWGRYPVKLNRSAALRAWARAIREHDFSVIMDGLERWIGCKQWMDDDGRFIPKAEKWLKEEWFLQKPEAAVPCGASGQLGQAEKEAIRRLFE